ncbi:helix-turn-helix domain-containing protein [Nocardiopsis tropica]|uniref:helix-turn-helix domain-containing protein n=1 Tax=Nocardiopsis tropica TaxID=109330 RepID=UPI0031DE1412
MTAEPGPAHTAPGPPTWARMLELLAEDRENLVDDFLRRLGDLGGYTGGAVPEDDLRRTASDTLDMLIRRIAGAPLPARLRGLPERLGVRRARQGVPREKLLEAVRLDFRVIWAGLVRAGGPGSSEVLVLHAEEILTTVEEYISDVQAAFLEERAVLARDSRAVTAQAFSRLLNSGERSAEVASEVAAVLGLPEHGRFEVAFVAASSAARGGAQARITRERERGRHLSWEFDDGIALVREVGGPGWAASLEGVAGGLVADAAGLAAVPAAVGAARVLSRYAGERGGLVREDDVWFAVAGDQVRRVLPGFGGGAAARLARLAPGPRARLMETLSHYTATGSVKDTAASLYCHRNTVVNRLQAFREVTGLDLTVPREAARALVLFAPEHPPGRP